MANTGEELQAESPELVLPVLILGRYLYFLARRPISESNLHYRATHVSGLQTLIPLLDNPAHPTLVQVAQILRTLTPSNLVHIAPAVQRAMRLFKEPLLPRSYVSATQPPDAEFFAGVQRVLVLIGPAIGIGDEIICFSIPRGLRSILAAHGRQVHITVASSYPQVWDRVDGVDAVEPYSDMQGLLRCVRSGSFDLLMVVDFETPGFTNALCFEPTVDRYIELSLGPREMLLLDKRRERQWRMPEAEPLFENYYDCMRHMLHWLGAPQELSAEDLMRHHELPARSGELLIFVNPFTSKEDPSERYWSELLERMLPSDLGIPVRILINTGPNLATRSLAFRMARRILSLGRPHLQCEVPYHPGRPGATISIGDIFLFSDMADVIVTADSFPAHAAQLFRKLTIVLGRENTQNWRSPSLNSFYFSSTRDLGEVSLGIQCLLRDALTTSQVRAEHFPAASVQLMVELSSSAAHLEHLLNSAAHPHDLAEAKRWAVAWAACRSAQASALESLANCHAGYSVLFDDNVYDDLLPRLPDSLLCDADLWEHRRHRFREWRNANLNKYALLLERPSVIQPVEMAAS